MDLSLERIMYCVESEILGAREKFPSNKHMLAAFSEEAGEVAREMLQNEYGKGSRAKVFKELVQTMAMAVRLIQEGDQDFEYRPEYKSYEDFKPTGNLAWKKTNIGS